MRDYAEEVKRLRKYEKMDAYSRYRPVCRDAADAIEALQAEIEQFKAQVPHWVSVEERLPRKYENVITADKHGNVQWNYLINEKYGTWSNGYHITHWMSLPEPPKEVE